MRLIAYQKCDAEYDKFQIEGHVIETISRMITAFQTLYVSFNSGFL